MKHRRFYFYCQHVLPLVYDESLSYYEVLCKLADYIKDLTEDVENLQDLANKLQVDINTLRQEFLVYQTTVTNEFNAVRQEMQDNFNDLQQQIDAIKNGSLIDVYIKALQDYIDKNLQSLVAGIVKYVVFGLNNDGHFVAYIPESWQFMQFDTIEDVDSPLYGHLVVQW